MQKQERVTLYGMDCRDAMGLFMAENSVDSIVTDLAAGTAAEHLVCADLLLTGHVAFLTSQTCAYDVAVDIAGRMLRIQVKATRMPRAIPQRVGHFPAYMWHVRRAGKAGKRVYGDAEFDLLALVALDSRQIAYLPPSQVLQTVHIRPDDSRPQSSKTGKKFADFSFTHAIETVARLAAETGAQA